MKKVAGIRFKRAGKIYDFDANGLDLKPGNQVIVEVDKGMGMGRVVTPPREVDPSKLSRKLKKIIRVADAVDMERHGFNSEREDEAFRVCRDKIARYGLPMKLVKVEYLFDSSKAIFYFTSETRVDFRELVKDLAGHFHTRIEMRQIGVRDEAKMLGGLGPCGRELCCAGFLSDFSPVTIKMAKAQNLALNPSKISGICGRLMCCLSYEYGMYKKGRGPEDSHKGCDKPCPKKAPPEKRDAPAAAAGAVGEAREKARPRGGGERKAGEEKKGDGRRDDRERRDGGKAGAEGEGEGRRRRKRRSRGRRRRKRRDGEQGGGEARQGREGSGSDSAKQENK